MEMHFHAPPMPAAAALVDHARRRLTYVLMHRRDRVQRVEVRLGRTHSRRGRDARYCVIRLQLHDAASLSVVDGGADLYDAIDRAADRAARLAAEHLLHGRS